MSKGHRLERKVDIALFMGLIKEMDENKIVISDHAVFRLDEKQRKIYKGYVIKEMILTRTPLLVDIQFNGCFAAFYRQDGSIMRLTLDFTPECIHIVTFYMMDGIPRF